MSFVAWSFGLKGKSGLRGEWLGRWDVTNFYSHSRVRVDLKNNWDIPFRNVLGRGMQAVVSAISHRSDHAEITRVVGTSRMEFA